MTGTDVLEEAYLWICKQREEHSHNNSVWDLRFNWVSIKPALIKELIDGTYTLSPMQSYTINGARISCWTALDALVLKAITIILQPLISSETSHHCTHLKNGGGIHKAIADVSAQKQHYTHLLKSDVYHYYESIDHQILLSSLEEIIECQHLLRLIQQYCERVEIREGHYYRFQRGIPMGCPLSPLIAAIYLKPLDDEVKKHGLYRRFMDDWVVLIKTKRELRKVIKLTHKILNALKIKMHPQKTFLGCIKKGFDFLGVHFGDKPEISKTSLENHHAKIAQRYAQGASTACIGAYIARWSSWCFGVLKSCINDGSFLNAMSPLINSSTGDRAQSKEILHETLLCQFR